MRRVRRLTREEKGMQRKLRGQVDGVTEERKKKAKGRKGREVNKFKEGRKGKKEKEREARRVGTQGVLWISSDRADQMGPKIKTQKNPLTKHYPPKNSILNF